MTLRIYYPLDNVLKRKDRTDVTPPAPTGALGISPLGTAPLGGSA